MTNDECTRYLKILGIEPALPTLELLRRIVSAQLATIPFENVSKLVQLKTSDYRGIPSLGQYLDSVERHHFGGTCYSTNFYLGQLLDHLGFEVRLCGADMSNPDIHIVNMVRVEGREYIVDGGYASPLIVPLPRDLPDDFVLEQGMHRYVLRPKDGEGRSRLDYYRNGVLTHGYTAKPQARAFEEFTQVVADSFRPTATFMNALLITRFGADHSDIIHNREYLRGDHGSSRKLIYENNSELARGIREVFKMPRDLIRLTLEGMSFDRDAW